MKKQVTVSLPGRDSLSLEITLADRKEENSSTDTNNARLVTQSKLTGTGCTRLLELIKEWRPKITGDLNHIPVPDSNDHSALLLRELILRIKDKWDPPYKDLELCHCRTVPTQTVNNAIISGCHNVKAVSQKTSASTSCGTCRPDVEAQIQYYVETSKL